MVGILNESETKSMLFYCDEIKGSANSQNMKVHFLKSLNLLFKNQINYNQIYLIVTDQANYNLTFGQNLKNSKLFPNLMHITCLAHCLHRISDKIRKIYPKTDSFVKSFKKYFRPVQVQNFYKIKSELPIPPNYINTRWTTWLKTVKYYYDNFSKVKKYVNISDIKQNSYLKTIRRIINSKNFRRELNIIDKYNFLLAFIKKLESPKLTVNQSYNLIKLTYNFIKDRRILKGLNFSLKRNPDLYKLLDYIKTDSDLIYAPLVSVDVERSFSVLKYITMNRNNISLNNLKKHVIIKYNKF
jgi:hypothetical protein